MFQNIYSDIWSTPILTIASLWLGRQSFVCCNTLYRVKVTLVLK